ncbi:MAG: hypothetical protein FJ126_00185 [Deltaproteobacteria bacterium]|nr:hypothetical protein [Deltaproteobacteria bacterium]
MKKLMGIRAMLLAGLLVIPGNFGLAGRVLAQSDSGAIGDKQMQELRQKREEQWQDQERRRQKMEDTGKRQQDATKRQQDAVKRQKAAEQRLRELEEKK